MHMLVYLLIATCWLHAYRIIASASRELTEALSACFVRPTASNSTEDAMDRGNAGNVVKKIKLKLFRQKPSQNVRHLLTRQDEDTATASPVARCSVPIQVNNKPWFPGSMYRAFAGSNILRLIITTLHIATSEAQRSLPSALPCKVLREQQWASFKGSPDVHQ